MGKAKKGCMGHSNLMMPLFQLGEAPRPGEKVSGARTDAADVTLDVVNWRNVARGMLRFLFVLSGGPAAETHDAAVRTSRS